MLFLKSHRFLCQIEKAYLSFWSFPSLTPSPAKFSSLLRQLLFIHAHKLSLDGSDRFTAAPFPLRPSLTIRILMGLYFPLSDINTIFGCNTDNIAISPLGHFASSKREEPRPLSRLARRRGFENDLWIEIRPENKRRGICRCVDVNATI